MADFSSRLQRYACTRSPLVLFRLRIEVSSNLSTSWPNVLLLFKEERLHRYGSPI